LGGRLRAVLGRAAGGGVEAPASGEQLARAGGGLGARWPTQRALGGLASAGRRARVAVSGAGASAGRRAACGERRRRRASGRWEVK